MVLLMLFALVAGAATALSPCVLPVLPAVLSAPASRAGGGGRSASSPASSLAFTFATVALVYVIDALGLPDDLAAQRSRSSTLFVFGITLLIPGLGDRIEAFGSRIAPGPARVGGDGFGSGLAARRQPRPRLHALRRADPRRRDHGLRRAGLHRRQARGGARLRGRLRRRALPADARRPPVVDRLQPAARLGPGGDRGGDDAGRGGDVADLDLRFQNAIADDLPSFLVNPTGELEAVERGRPTTSPRCAAAAARPRRPAARRPRRAADLPMLGAGARLHRHPAVVQHPAARPLSIIELTARAGWC